MELDLDTCYRALESHDVRFDGVFFVGVQTTGIYCRTVCPARTPRRDRCTFHRSAAAAEHAGFRPCLRCRPELAPGNARIDASNRLAALAYSRIEDGALNGESGGVVPLAAELGVSPRHLRRVVQNAFGVAPAALAQTQRLLLAKRLLADTALPITEIAFASGFGSLRRFNTLFQERYRLNPTDLRRARPAATTESFDCHLSYRPPLDWNSLLRFLGDRSLVGVESVEGDVYRRTIRLGKASGWLAVTPAGSGRDQLRVTVSSSLAPGLLPLLARIKRAFDLGADPASIAAHLGDLGGLATFRPGLRVPGAFDGFEIAIRAILGQQISVRAATTLACRFAHAFGEPIRTPYADLNRLTPTAERVASAAPESLTALGIVGARARAIIGLACAVAEGTITLQTTADPEATIAHLQTLPGIGAWTAQYIALRALAYPDAFPHTDLVIAKALGETNPQRVLARAEAWRPWRAYAAIHLWQTVKNCQESLKNEEKNQ